MFPETAHQAARHLDTLARPARAVLEQICDKLVTSCVSAAGAGMSDARRDVARRADSAIAPALRVGLIEPASRDASPFLP